MPLLGNSHTGNAVETLPLASFQLSETLATSVEEKITGRDSVWQTGPEPETTAEPEPERTEENQSQEEVVCSRNTAEARVWVWWWHNVHKSLPFTRNPWSVLSGYQESTGRGVHYTCHQASWIGLISMCPPTQNWLRCQWECTTSKNNETDVWWGCSSQMQANQANTWPVHDIIQWTHQISWQADPPMQIQIISML